MTKEAGSRRPRCLCGGARPRVALTWDQPGRYHAAGLATMADFDLILAGSKGTEEAAACHRQGAFEVLEFRAPRDGKYTLSIEPRASRHG